MHSHTTTEAVARKRVVPLLRNASLVSVHKGSGRLIGCVIKETSVNGDRSPFAPGAAVEIIPRFYGNTLGALLDAAHGVERLYTQRRLG